MKDRLSFFGLSDEPFRLTPDIDYFYPSKSHKEALELLSYFLKDGDGFALLVGYPGVGKTTLLKKLLTKIKEDLEIALIVAPMLTPNELIKSILNDLGIESNKDSLSENIQILQDYILQLAKSGKKLLLIIDEAQSLPLESLEQVRLLSNIETHNQKPLQIILSGQPELEVMVKDKLPQLNQRITIRCYINSLNRDETIDYIQYRMAKANGSIDLTKKAKDEIFEVTKGIPRLINSLMKRSLVLAFARKMKQIDKKDIIEAAKSLELYQENTILSVLIGIIIAMLVLMIAMLLVYYDLLI